MGEEEVAAAEVKVEEVEKLLGYTFEDKALVEEALTHPSYYKHPFFDRERDGDAPNPTYERLEFVGDAVINCLMARELFYEYHDLPPGTLTLLRAANVDTEKLARVAVQRGLHLHIRHRNPLLQSQIQQFEEDVALYPIHSNGLVDTPKVLADIVESLIGAVCLDSKSNLEIVWAVFKRLAQPLVKVETLGRHPVSQLYELCQKRKMMIEFKDTWVQNTEITVLIDGNEIGRATYKGKKEIAHNRAAKVALDKLKISLEEKGKE